MEGAGAGETEAKKDGEEASEESYYDTEEEEEEEAHNDQKENEDTNVVSEPVGPQQLTAEEIAEAKRGSFLGDMYRIRDAMIARRKEKAE